MGCQKKIAETVLGKGADYLLAVKGNQPNMFTKINNKDAIDIYVREDYVHVGPGYYYLVYVNPIIA